MGRGFKSFLVQACVHSIVRYEIRPGFQGFFLRDLQGWWLPKHPGPHISLLNYLDQPVPPVFPPHCSSSWWEMVMSLAWIEAGPCWDKNSFPGTFSHSHCSHPEGSPMLALLDQSLFFTGRPNWMQGPRWRDGPLWELWKSSQGNFQALPWGDLP